MTSADQPHAEQIIDINEDKKIVPRLDTLHKILLQDEIKDKHVCVVSITGTYRPGKSFLLNFLLHFLNLRYKGKKDVTNWLGSNDEPISGFPWKSGSLRHTFGILIWSEVFLAELSTGEEIAIILLDTQGSFDNGTRLAESASIFALTALVSSMQIYNLKEGLRQYDLSNLQSEGGQFFLDSELKIDETQPSDLVSLKQDFKKIFEKLECFLLPYPGKASAIVHHKTIVNESISLYENVMDFVKDRNCKALDEYALHEEHTRNYGQCIFDKKNNCSFQNLLVLIRDWPYPHEYKFGAEGGREFLNCELGSNELQSSDLIALKDDVKNLFESISCFLLPHPGRSITAATALEGIDNEFKKYVELLGSTILAPENLIAKKVNGEKVKATAEVHHKDTIEESIALYENLMAFIKIRESKSLGKNLVYKKHCESKSTAIAYFRTKRKMGDKATNDKYDLVLQQVS
ncbi:GBP domain containing protein [Asbolus verrucosus]|uniref:GBP domain containing protein n=1 Tax=Asbolus verrucosus TaxID=1661398 RepID=A0A482W8H4_ASBVE|nr:GBP domain containing protein [Asbolus verrucosus]